MFLGLTLYVSSMKKVPRGTSTSQIIPVPRGSDAVSMNRFKSFILWHCSYSPESDHINPEEKPKTSDADIAPCSLMPPKCPGLGIILSTKCDRHVHKQLLDDFLVNFFLQK